MLARAACFTCDSNATRYNLMNEPRSTVDLVVEQRQAATGPVYNITRNNGNTLQRWIEDMAQYVKRRATHGRAAPSLLLLLLSPASSSGENQPALISRAPCWLPSPAA